MVANPGKITMAISGAQESEKDYKDRRPCRDARVICHLRYSLPTKWTTRGQKAVKKTPSRRCHCGRHQDLSGSIQQIIRSKLFGLWIYVLEARRPVLA